MPRRCWLATPWLLLPAMCRLVCSLRSPTHNQLQSTEARAASGRVREWHALSVAFPPLLSPTHRHSLPLHQSHTLPHLASRRRCVVAGGWIVATEKRGKRARLRRMHETPPCSLPLLLSSRLSHTLTAIQAAAPTEMESPPAAAAAATGGSGAAAKPVEADFKW